MAFVLRVTPHGLTAETYAECLKRLEAAGQGAPAGRLYHVCFGDTNNLRVSDIWDSMDSFTRFGETLMPILKDLGVTMGEPEMIEVHNIIAGRQSTTASG